MAPKKRGTSGRTALLTRKANDCHDPTGEHQELLSFQIPLSTLSTGSNSLKAARLGIAPGLPQTHATGQQSKRAIDVRIQHYSSNTLPPSLHDWAFNLIKTSLQSLYEPVWGWQDEKKHTQLRAASSRFLVAWARKSFEQPLPEPSTAAVTANFTNTEQQSPQCQHSTDRNDSKHMLQETSPPTSQQKDAHKVKDQNGSDTTVELGLGKNESLERDRMQSRSEEEDQLKSDRSNLGSHADDTATQPPVQTQTDDSAKRRDTDNETLLLEPGKQHNTGTGIQKDEQEADDRSHDANKDGTSDTNTAGPTVVVLDDQNSASTQAGILVVMEDGWEAAAYINYRFEEGYDKDPVLYVYELMVAPQWQRLGLASKLTHLAEQIAWEQGMDKVVLTVLVANTAAKKLYSACQYRRDKASPDLSEGYEILSKSNPALTSKKTKDAAHARKHR